MNDRINKIGRNRDLAVAVMTLLLVGAFMAGALLESVVPIVAVFALLGVIVFLGY